MKLWLGLGIFATVLICLMFYIAYFYVPNVLKTNVARWFYEAGYTDTSFIENGSSQAGGLKLSQIALDEEGFQTIDDLKLSANPFSFPLTHRVGRIEVSGLKSTAAIELSDLFNSSTFLALSLLGRSLTSAKKVEIQDSRVVALIPNFGGVTVNYEGSADRSGGVTEVQASFRTQQKTLGGEGQILGNIHEDDHWGVDINVNDGKINVPGLRLSRFMSRHTISGYKDEINSGIGDYTIGGLSLLYIPWQDGAGTIEVTEGVTNFFLGARALGGAELELSVTGQYDQTEFKLMADIYSKDAQTLFSYLQTYGGKTTKSDNVDILPDFQSQKPVQLQIVADYSVSKAENKKLLTFPIKFRLLAGDAIRGYGKITFVRDDLAENFTFFRGTIVSEDIDVLNASLRLLEVLKMEFDPLGGKTIHFKGSL